MGNAWIMADGDSRAIRDPDGILADIYDAARLGDCRVGDSFEINGRRAKIVGMTKGIVSFTTNPYVFTTLERARKNYGADGGVPPTNVPTSWSRPRPASRSRTSATGSGPGPRAGRP